MRITRSWTGVDIKLIPGFGKKFLKENANLREQLFRVGNEAGAVVIDPYYQLCSDGECRVLYEGNHPIYYDGAHLADRWVRKHATYLDKTLILD